MIWARLLRAVTSRYPLNTPRASVLKLLPPVPPNFGEFSGKHGVRYRGYWPGNDEVCGSLFWFGNFDPWVDYALRRFARPGSVAFDIGANIGATTITLANAVGPRGRVFCFEPIPANAKFLSQNLAANNLKTVQLETVALSDCSGELSMILPHDHAGMSHVLGDSSSLNGLRVTSIAFDDWIEMQPKLAISVCKVDVEGHEARVFAGMKRTLSKQLIPAFVFERHIRGEVTTDPVFELLTSYGYRLSRIDKGLMSVAFVDIASPPKGFPTNDFVAVLPEVFALENSGYK